MPHRDCKFKLDIMQKFRATYRTSQARISATLNCANLTPTQYSILEVLYDEKKMSISDVMNKVNSTKGNMTVVIKNMLDKGWIMRCESSCDKRKSEVWLSEEGIKLVENYIPIYKEAIDTMFEDFSSEELLIFNELLSKINNKEG